MEVGEWKDKTPFVRPTQFVTVQMFMQSYKGCKGRCKCNQSQLLCTELNAKGITVELKDFV